MNGRINPWITIAGLAALALVLLVESVLIVENYRAGVPDRDPPSLSSESMRELFGRR